MKPGRIGTLLLDAGIVDAGQLKAALERKSRFGGKLVTNCLALGFASEHALATVLSYQLGGPFVVLSKSVIPLNLLDAFSRETAQKLRALPIRRVGRVLFVAMAEPTNIAYLDELRFITGVRIVEHGALEGVLTDAIQDAYRLRDAGTSIVLEGADFDLSNRIEGDGGYLEIVTGRDLASRLHVPPEAPDLQDASAGIDIELDWNSVQPSVPPAQKGGLPVVLLVDDDDDLRHMLTDYLQKSGFEVWEAADGTQALQILQTRVPDVMVLDAMLPGVHGFDICQQVKQSRTTSHIPVVMVSAIYRGWGYSEDVKRLYGADAYLEKPLSLKELNHVLTQFLSSRSGAPPSEELSRGASSSLQRAVEAYQQGDLRGTVRLLEEAMEASPFSPQLHERLGILYTRLNEPYRAIAEVARAVELEPSCSRLLKLAQLYEKTGFTQRARETWECCLRCCEDPETAEHIRNHLLNFQGRGG